MRTTGRSKVLPTATHLEQGSNERPSMAERKHRGHGVPASSEQQVIHHAMSATPSSTRPSGSSSCGVPARPPHHSARLRLCQTMASSSAVGHRRHSTMHHHYVNANQTGGWLMGASTLRRAAACLPLEALDISVSDGDGAVFEFGGW